VQFVGVVDYSTSTYHVYIVNQKRTVDTWNVVFNEHESLHLAKPLPPLTHIPLLDYDSDEDKFPPVSPPVDS
jgi:hypothetical protein